LVHADLSAFNILNFDEKPVFIDFSQTTTSKNPHAEEYLNRDIKNITSFFKKLGVKVEAHEIKEEILKA
jgi:RIO kinase 1